MNITRISKHRFVWTILLAAVPVCRLAAQPATACDVSTLNKTYAFAFNARAISNGTIGAVGQDIGTAAMDGKGNATINVTFNSNAETGQTETATATYALGGDCTGTITEVGGSTFNLVVYGQGGAFTLSGNSDEQVVAGAGAVAPGACLTSTLSGPFMFNANGFVLSGTTVTGVADVTGRLQFDGMGNATATWTTANGTTATTVNAGGQYSLGSNCQGAATLNDSANMVAYVFTFGIIGNGNNFNLIASSPSLIFAGAGHATIVNPGQAVVNAASYQANNSSPGTIFSIFGQDLAGGVTQATMLPLPDTLGTTSVTVNGESAPLFYVAPGQINAQIPTDIKPGPATVIVTNGTQSNAVAAIVPGVSPGIIIYGTNHAVVQNQDGSVNGENAPAHVGDTLVVYFVGGGPVSVPGALETGQAAPNEIAPITNNHNVTVNGVSSPKVSYMGLTPGFVGLYQANFVVPQVPSGDQPLAIFINGQKSNAQAPQPPVITIAE